MLCQVYKDLFILGKNLNMILIDLLWTEIDATGSQWIYFYINDFCNCLCMTCLSTNFLKISDEQKTNWTYFL